MGLWVIVKVFGSCDWRLGVLVEFWTRGKMGICYAVIDERYCGRDQSVPVCEVGVGQRYVLTPGG